MPTRRGPAPLPTAVKELRGTMKKSRRNEKEPKPPIGDPGIPSSVRLDKDAKECWTSVVSRLVKLKVVSIIDGAALEGMCMAFARARQADRLLKKNGLVIKNAWGTLQQNPAVAISKGSWAEFRKFAQEFGITPSSRSRVQGAGDGENDADETEDLIFGDKSKIAGSIGPRR